METCYHGNCCEALVLMVSPVCCQLVLALSVACNYVPDTGTEVLSERRTTKPIQLPLQPYNIFEC